MRVKIEVRSKEEMEWLRRMSEGLQVLVDRILLEREKQKSNEEWLEEREGKEKKSK